MASWDEFAAAAPAMAEAGRRLLPPLCIAYLATAGAAGVPQVHPVCPIVAGGRLFVAVGHASPKLRDLRANGRYMMHALPGADDEEFAVRGLAREMNDAATRALVIANAGGFNVNPAEVIFEFDIERADHAVWENVGQPDTRPVRQRWTAARIGN